MVALIFWGFYPASSCRWLPGGFLGGLVESVTRRGLVVQGEGLSWGLGAVLGLLSSPMPFHGTFFPKTVLAPGSAQHRGSCRGGDGDTRPSPSSPRGALGAAHPEPPAWLVGVAFRGRPWGMGVARKTPKVCANGPAPAQGPQICVPKCERLWVSTRELGRALGGLVLIPGKPLPGVFSPWEGAGGAPPGEVPGGGCFSLGNEPPLWGFFPAHPSDGQWHASPGAPCLGWVLRGHGGSPGQAGREQRSPIFLFFFFFQAKK